MRHVIEPELTAAIYAESDSVVDQRNILNLALRQRLQTKRGIGDKRRTVDWMRLDLDVTFVEDPADAADSGPDRFIWNRPLVPLRVFSSPEIFNGNLLLWSLKGEKVLLYVGP